LALPQPPFLKKKKKKKKKKPTKQTKSQAAYLQRFTLSPWRNKSILPEQATSLLLPKPGGLRALRAFPTPQFLHQEHPVNPGPPVTTLGGRWQRPRINNRFFQTIPAGVAQVIKKKRKWSREVRPIKEKCKGQCGCHLLSQKGNSFP
jgi:hypothetical protein